MTSSLLSGLNLNSVPTKKFVLIEQSAKADGAFLISALLGHRVNLDKSGVILVCADQTFQHYDTVGSRWAHRLVLHKDKGALKVIESQKFLFENFLTDTKTTEDYLEKFSFLIEDGVKEFLEQGKENISVIIDNLTFYLDMFDAGDSWAVEFCEQLYKLTETHPAVSVVVKVNEHEFQELVCQHLEDLASPVVTVAAFETGPFQEVDGKIIIKETHNFDDLIPKTQEKTQLSTTPLTLVICSLITRLIIINSISPIKL